MTHATPNEPSSSVGMLDRILARIVPARFLTPEHAFYSKVLWVYTTSIGGLGLIILLALSFSEGSVPLRRLGTVFLASLLCIAPVLMRYFQTLKPISIYVVLVSITLIFYVDFNNLSIQGPSGVLWLVPIMLVIILFSGWQIISLISLCVFLFVLNIFFLKQGILPTAIVKAESFETIRVIYICAVSIILILSIRGISKIAQNHLKELQQEIETKQNRINQINALKMEAEASVRSKSVFLATMSHELRTPLNSVIGNAQILNRADLPSKYHAQVNDISIAANLLLMLINDILDFSKLEENKLEFIDEPYDLSEQLSELCRMMQPRLKNTVSLDISLPVEKVFINADQNRIAQVLMNLISNAIKFTDKGSVHVLLEVNAKEGVCISVVDTGIGIRQEDIEKLFVKFSQVSHDSTRNMQGTGLGLAIALGLIKKMGGDIQVSSEYNQGSCFKVVLPKNRLVDLHVPTVEKHHEEASELSLKGSCVLVVDDIMMNCAMLESMLETYSADHIISVNSGIEAVDYVKQNSPPDLILMDMRMPGMDGIETTGVIREQGYQGVIIAITANATADDERDCLAAGMNGFMAKPVVMEELERVINTLLKQQ